MFALADNLRTLGTQMNDDMLSLLRDDLKIFEQDSDEENGGAVIDDKIKGLCNQYGISIDMFESTVEQFGLTGDMLERDLGASMELLLTKLSTASADLESIFLEPYM